MRRIFSTLLVLLTFVSMAEKSIEKEVDHIISLMKVDTDSAIALSQNLLEYARDQDDDYGIVQSNYILGYIYDKLDVNYGKSIIYYLEAIRYAEEASFEEANEKLISLYKNCGVIFRKFNSFDLAVDYYLKGLELARYSNNTTQINSITYNMAGLYSDMGLIEEAISLLEDISATLKPSDSKFYDLNNRLSQIYLDNKQTDKAELIANKILRLGTPSNTEVIDTHQILGRVALIKGLDKEAERNFLVAIEAAETEMNEYHRNKALYETYSDLGILRFEQRLYDEALNYYTLAEEKVSFLNQKPEFFKVQKLIANTHYRLGNYELTKIYEDKYSENLNRYLQMQEELQENDKKYNLDLITRRYFDEVAKQERIASILFYSRLVSGSLLALLLFTIAFNYYQKVRLRKSIVQELIDLKMIN